MSRATDIDINFGERVRQERRARNLTQTELGKGAGISNPQARIERIENGHSPATIAEALRIAAALGGSVDSLMAELDLSVACARCAVARDAVEQLAALLGDDGGA